MNQESYSNARQTELSLPVNENLSEALENEIRPNMSVSTSSEFNDSEIPSKFIRNMKLLFYFSTTFSYVFSGTQCL